MTSNTSNSIHLFCTCSKNNWNGAQIFFYITFLYWGQCLGVTVMNFRRSVS